MSTDRPHTHHCGYCDRDVPCFVVERGEPCIFPSTSDVTCEACAEEQVRKIKEARLHV